MSDCVFLPKVVQWFSLKKANKYSKISNFPQVPFWFNKQLSTHSDPAEFLINSMPSEDQIFCLGCQGTHEGWLLKSTGPMKWIYYLALAYVVYSLDSNFYILIQEKSSKILLFVLPQCSARSHFLEKSIQMPVIA